MKAMRWLVPLCLLLTGCGAENRELKEAMAFRETLLAAQSCVFQAEVTADYGEALHEFSMDCQGDSLGVLRFEVTAPESIAGISGSISEAGGNILFDDEALYFPLLTDRQLIPASAPWIFLRSLRSGCITSVCREEELLRLTLDDSYEEDALTLDVWLNQGSQPVGADILYGGKRILSLEIENFVVS